MSNHKTCENCGNSFEKNPRLSEKQWVLSKFCSRRCAARKNAGASVLERFFSFVEIDPITRCWNWIGTKDENGYGFFGSNRAHRASYMMCVGEIPEGKLALHRCDNVSCVNPFHIFIGDHQDNVDDMKMKGRDNYAFGERATARLTEAEVLKIRSDPRLQEEIAGDYGIAQTTVSAIKRRVNWKYLP